MTGRRAVTPRAQGPRPAAAGRGRAPGLLLALAPALLAGPGCAFLGAPPPRPADPEPATPYEGPIEAECLAVEFDARSDEIGEAKVRAQDGVRFRYGTARAAVDALVERGPRVVFLLAHGWQNDPSSGRAFSASLIRGVRARAGAEAERAGFLAVHWDSQRPLFHESAVNAELIGRDRVRPLLADLRARLAARVVLVGHSLGGRLALAALDGGDGQTTPLAHGAVLLQAAADEGALLPDERPGALGRFPRAAARCGLIASVCSTRDDVLLHAYANAMFSPALGREGALRAPGERFATIPGEGAAVDEAALAAARASDAARSAAGGRFVNVDATAVVAGHSEVMVPLVFDLIWRVGGD